MKKRILVVEDEAILYRRIRKILENENFIVHEYTPSYDKALVNIQKNRPDLVLLDIELQGDKTGIDLGKELYEVYKIPFIYVTQFDDDHTFYSGLSTHHELFLVKTKPRLNPKEIIRAVHTVLNKKNEEKNFSKEGVFGLVEYLSNLKEYSNNQVTKVPVKFSDIAFFTLDLFVNQDNEKEKLRANYLWFLTKEKEHYFLYSSLNELLGKLPHYFVRINESYIVNISPDMLQGQVKLSRISIMNYELNISDTYKEEVRKRFKQIYL